MPTLPTGPQEQPFWLSWWHHPQRYANFELHTPWWVSGYRPDDDADSIVAAVMAESPTDAEGLIRLAYDTPPDRIEFRFVEPQQPGWEPFSDRFPRARWMRWPA